MVEKSLSRTQVDRLGERLRRLEYGEAELRSLDEYRRTFGPTYDRVVERIHGITGVPVSGRPAKSTSSIIEKLNREYGGGPEPARSVLDRAAHQIHRIETVESKLAQAGVANSMLAQELRDIRNAYIASMQNFVKDLAETDRSISS